MTTTTIRNTSEPADSWRDNLKITRTGIFAVLFVLMGAWMLLGSAQAFAPETTTRLTFGDDLPEILVSTQPYTLAVGAFYVLTGAVGLLPIAALRRPRFLLMLLGGVLLVPTVLIIAAANNSINVTVMLQVSLRLSTPVVMGALAGIWCERAGVVNIAIEGMMLTGACFGFTTFTLLLATMDTPSAQLVGVVVATLTGGIMAVLHAWLSITFKTNQIVSGTVINILAVGVTSFVRRDILLSSEAARETLQSVPIGSLSEIPVLGDVLFNGRPIFYAMFVLLFATHIILFYTRWGLRTRAVGENPKAADTLGINVQRNRWINVLIGGLIAGLAGAWFSMETSGSFDDNMTSGRGFIALAAMIFGKWMPFGAFGGGLLFGFSDALGQRFQFLGVPVPPQFLQMVPYAITIVVLAGLVGRAVGPKAAGEPYEKEGK
jgi:simple sugar transport system permease protein